MTLYEWVSTLVLVGGVQGILLFLAINKFKKGDVEANKYLSYFILIIAITLFGRYYFNVRIDSILENKILFIGDFSIYLLGPLLYFYFANLFNKKTFKFSKDWKHFIPIAAYIIMIMPILIVDQEGYVPLLRKIYPYFRIVEIAAIIQSAVYVSASFLIIKKFNKQIENKISFSVQLRFYNSFFIIVVFILGFWLISFINSFAGNRSLLPIFDYHSVWFSISFLVFTLGYYTLAYPEIFSKLITDEKAEVSSEINVELDEVFNHIKNIMVEQKPHLEPRLTLQKLSELTEINTHQLSKVINEKFKKNFFEFVNYYRVEEFKNLTKEDSAKNLTLLALAYKAGFNSKTTFNTAFKKITRQTPKEYLKSKT